MPRALSRPVRRERDATRLGGESALRRPLRSHTPRGTREGRPRPRVRL